LILGESFSLSHSWTHLHNFWFTGPHHFVEKFINSNFRAYTIKHTWPLLFWICWYSQLLCWFILVLKLFCCFWRKKWLRHTGSPQSRIDRCEFKNKRTIDKPEFEKFSIRKWLNILFVTIPILQWLFFLWKRTRFHM